MNVLIDTIARATQDSTERLVLLISIVQEVRNSCYTETRGDCQTNFHCFKTVASHA